MNRDKYLEDYARLGNTRTRFVECMKITRRDGGVYRFTAHDADLEVQEEPGVTYTYKKADSFKMSALESSLGLAVTNMDAEIIIDDATITTSDLLGGLFDQARIDIGLVAWGNHLPTIVPLRVSWIGEIAINGVSFKGDLRGISQKLANTFINLTSLECRWRFGDSNCAVDLTTHTLDLTVAEVSSNDIFRVVLSSPNYGKFALGRLVWLTGYNVGNEMEILGNDRDYFFLFLPMTKEVRVGDTLRAVAGCNKTYTTCGTSFGNVARFGGEPFLAGNDLLQTYPVSVSPAGKEGK